MYPTEKILHLNWHTRFIDYLRSGNSRWFTLIFATWPLFTLWVKREKISPENSNYNLDTNRYKTEEGVVGAKELDDPCIRVISKQIVSFDWNSQKIYENLETSNAFGKPKVQDIPPKQAHESRMRVVLQLTRPSYHSKIAEIDNAERRTVQSGWCHPTRGSNIFGFPTSPRS